MPNTSAISFDYIIVGGGTAGCVLAARLTEDPGCKVLLLEAGPRRESVWVRIPAGFTKLLTNPRHNWGLRTEPEEATNSRVIAIPKGKGLGGSTLINGMIFVRGQPGDYDRWAQRAGWGWDDVLPYFNRLERFEGTGPNRGTSGPLPIRRVSDRPEIAEAFIDAAVAAGHPRNDDYNGEDQTGFGYYQVNQQNGRRVSAADAYLKPALNRPNLLVLTGAAVERIVLEGRRATGVQARIRGEMRSFSANVEVILAAGAVHSPQILELSGIGAPAVLAAANIRTLHASPGVGENYRDHFCTRMNWRVRLPVTLNEQTRGLHLMRAVAQYALTRRGILTYATGLAHGFLHSRPGLSGPDVQLFFMHASYANAAERRLDREPGMTVGVSQMRPQSRGSIHIGSADVTRQPLIRPNFLAEEEDRRCMVEGMKATRHLMAQGALDKFRGVELAPGPGVQSDADWLQFARDDGQTIYHASGTCRMGDDPEAVVDARLRVKGLSGLRVVDASVMPEIVSGNIQASVFMIAEKAADMIREDARTRSAVTA